MRMKDIAGLLGVSQTTVSHVLRGREKEFRIGAETAARVRETAARLDYQPSALARGFKDQRAYSLCLAVGDLTNPFWSGLAVGAYHEAEKNGYSLVVSHTGETLEKERGVVELLRARRVDGLILSPVGHRNQHLVALRKAHRPFVLVDRYIDGLDVPSVFTDSIAGMEMAVEHLVERGHRQIAYLGGAPSISTFRERARGFQEAMKRRRLRPTRVGVAPSEPEPARLAAERLFSGAGRPTAVVAANFWLTVGVLRAAPRDVAVVGFDELFLADLLRRPVTTIAQPVEDLGRESVRLLLEEIARPGKARRVVLPPRLVVRQDVWS